MNKSDIPFILIEDSQISQPIYPKNLEIQQKSKLSFRGNSLQTSLKQVNAVVYNWRNHPLLFMLMATAMHYYLGTALLFFSLFASLIRKPTISLLLNSSIFLILFHAYLSDNLLLQNVYYSSHSGLPFYYKIIASWTTHEGSMILWVWSLSLYAFFFSQIHRNSQIYQVVIIIQSHIVSIFLIFVISLSNPFKTFIFSPSEGMGLNPILQDSALMIHPPVLYLGYVGTSICFSIALAILLTGKSEKKEFKMLNFFLLLAFAFLTLGIALGGWWSYRELGWGGFWAWDPIENISLFPWLLLLGAIHSSFLALGKNRFKAITISLSLLAFITSVAGTFISRMGVTDSLHTFNTNTESGIYLLIIVIFLLTISTIIFIRRCHTLWKHNENIKTCTDLPFYLMLTQSILCIVLFMLVFLATLAPTISKTLGYDSVYIAQSFYNTTFGEIGIILAICISLFIAFKCKTVFKRLATLILLSTILSLGNFGNTFTALLSIMGVMTALSILIKRKHELKSEKSIQAILSSPKNAFFLTHLGFGLFLYAIAGFSSNSLENKQYLKPGDQIIINNYTVRFVKHDKINNDLFSGIKATFRINRGRILTPELRFYKREKKLNTESATLHHLLHDIQIIISGLDDELGLAVEIHYKDKIQLIWLSLILVVLGTFHKIVYHASGIDCNPTTRVSA